MERVVHIELPRWAAIVYGALAVILIPWIINLATNLPSRHLARHWDAVWTGFDVIMLITVALTLWFMFRRKVWVVITASALATLFLVDVWFDVLTSKPGREQRIAIIFGCLELILALFTYRLVYRVIHTATPQKNIRLITRGRNKA